MDKRIKEIKKEQRVALARIAYDLIMADNIIEPTLKRSIF